VATTLEFINSEQAACDWTKGECNQLLPFTHQDEIIIHRLRIGHTYPMRRYLLRGETACQVVLTVEHILLHCLSSMLVVIFSVLL